MPGEQSRGFAGLAHRVYRWRAVHVQRPDQNCANPGEHIHRGHRQRPGPTTQRRYDRDRQCDEAQPPDADEGHEDPGMRGTVAAELTDVLTNGRVVRFESASEYPPADEHDLR